MDIYLLAGIVVLGLVGALIALAVTLRFYGSSEGERRRKTRMQGSFVPLSAEDIADDEERIRKRRAAGHGEP